MGIAIFLGSVLVASISQIMLKKSADRKYDRWIDEYLNFRVIFAYGLFFLSSLLTVYAYKFVPLSLGPVLEASGYVFVSVMGYFILKEKIGKRKFLGLVVIIAGIVIFNL
ncbi:EamA family transporter [Lachnoclostridium sp. An138]|uniref:EamA family transporter n=1 Tax=Lachnoclostridium sp. An138 TaxID=1965560 RepID=UPI000B3760C6|nr:EamA family transporter [Lachnoclostridium sp. An138]OUQ17500.1 multidrug ABC transporter [Lachnoclostridium sp. An138]